MPNKYNNAVVWSQPQCPWCDRAKALLKQHNIATTVNMLGTNNLTKEDLLKAVPAARSVPQIFLDGEYVGGFEALQKVLSE